MRGHHALLFGLVGVALCPCVAQAAPPRPRFEPTDLEMEDPGTVELDMQFGASAGGKGKRVVLPDYELDIGILPNVELDFDGAFSMVQSEGSRFRFGLEPLWTSVKLGIYDTATPGSAGNYAVGLQLGPRWVGTDMHGLGYGALILGGYSSKRLHTVVNLGGLVDPAQADGPKRPWGAVAGFNVDLDLDDANRWSVLGAIAGAYYVAVYDNEATLSAGGAFSPNDSIELSLLAAVSPFSSHDRFALFFGVSPRFSVF